MEQAQLNWISGFLWNIADDVLRDLYEAPKSVPLYLKAKGIEARGFESPKGFVVRAGSKAVKEDKEVPSIHAYLKETRAELVRQGVFIDRGAAYELAQDYAFSSPSMELSSSGERQQVWPHSPGEQPAWLVCTGNGDSPGAIR